MQVANVTMPKTAGCGQAAGGHLDPGRGARDGWDQPLPQDRDDPLLANHQAGAGDAARGLRCQGRHLPGITGSERRRGRPAGKQQESVHHLPSGHGYRKERGIAGHGPGGPGGPGADAVAPPFQYPPVRFAEDDRLAAANAAEAWRAAVEGQHFPSRKRRIGPRRARRPPCSGPGHRVARHCPRLSLAVTPVSAHFRE